MKNIVLPVTAGGVLLLATVSIVRTQPIRHATTPPAPPPRVEFQDRVAAVGLVEASSENISISSHLPGVVEKVYVAAGDDVKAGTPLLKLDTRALEASLVERRADLATREAAVETARAQAQKARASLADVQRTLKFAESVSDSRSISAEEVTRRRSAVEIAEAEVQAADAQIAAAKAAVMASQAAIEAVGTDLARSTITAPVDGRVLQLRIHPGEYAMAGPPASPWLVLGSVTPLNVRVDIDEQEAWRVKSGCHASAQVRGNANLETPLQFVRFEPFVVPKQSLTGSSTERVDTRVMQAVYRVEREDLALFVGQQMDVFIAAGSAQPSIAKR